MYKLLEAERTMDVLRGDIASGYRDAALRTETALDPLRSRRDFQLLMMDVAFPSDQFVP